MDKIVAQYFSDEIANQAAAFFGAEFSKLKLLRDNVSIIYGFKQNGKEYILRIVHSSTEGKEKILSEVDWLHFLNAGGVNMSTPVESVNGNLMEVIPAGNTYFTAVKFNKAPGKKVSQFNWTPTVFRETGKVTGRIHRLTKEYVPAPDIIRRHDCIETDVKRAEKFFAGKHDDMLAKLNALMNKINLLPRDKESYGLVHNDINRGNMFIDKGKICLFDSADCAYTWFVTDIALTLFYAVQYKLSDPKNLIPHIGEFMANYWQGYLSENKIRENEIELIPSLMTLKAIFVYNHLLDLWDVNNLNHVQKNFFDQIYTFSHEGFDFINVNLIKP